MPQSDPSPVELTLELRSIFCLGHTMAEIVDVALRELSPYDVGTFVASKVFRISPTTGGLIKVKLFGADVSDMQLNSLAITEIIEAQDEWLVEPLQCEWVTNLKGSIFTLVITECPPCVSDSVWRSLTDSERTQLRVTWNQAGSATFRAQCLAAQLQARIDNGL